jgi:sulfonate transport system substrate-binding protein
METNEGGQPPGRIHPARRLLALASGPLASSSGRPLRPASRRRLGLVTGLTAAALAAALAAAGCSSSTPGSASGTSSAGTTNVSGVTLNIGDQKGTGAEAVLRAAGLLSKLPFTVHWTDFTSGPPMLQAMGSGAVDIGGVGDAPPVFAASGGSRIALVGARTNPPQAAALVVPKGSSITSPAQLRGKKIAVAQGSSADYHLLTVLKKAGLTTHDVTLDYLQPAEALAAITSGSVDAWDVWSPYIEQAVGQDHARVLVNGAGYGSNYAFEVASRAALGDPAKAAAIRDYLKLLNQAYTFTATHPQAWANAWASATGLPGSIMLTAAKDDTNTPATITPPVIAAEQNLVTAFYAAGLIPNKVNISAYSVDTFNDTVGGSSSSGGS